MEWLDFGAGCGEVLEDVAAVLPKGSKTYGIEPMAVRVRTHKGVPSRGLI